MQTCKGDTFEPSGPVPLFSSLDLTGMRHAIENSASAGAMNENTDMQSSELLNPAVVAESTRRPCSRCGHVTVRRYSRTLFVLSNLYITHRLQSNAHKRLERYMQRDIMFGQWRGAHRSPVTSHDVMRLDFALSTCRRRVMMMD